MRKWPLAALIAAALLAACSDKPAGGFQGYVEGEYVHIASPFGGRLQELYVSRGQTVAAQAPLFTLDSTEEIAARQQAEQQVKAAEAQLADMRLGKRKPELEIAQSQLRQAQAAEDLARQQAQRDEAQFEAGGISRAQLDDSRSNLVIKSARTSELKEQVRVTHLPARDDQILSQTAQVAAAKATASQLSWRVQQKELHASQAGLVADTLYRKGEWVPAGSPVVRLLPPANVKVRFFVPEAVAGGLVPGRELVLRCDGCNGDIAASIRFIATDPEFTPPVIYSNENRSKMVFMVEARPAVADAPRLRPGQPVFVILK